MLIPFGEVLDPNVCRGAGADERPRPRIDNALVKALARAYRWQRLLEDDRSYLCRVRRLTLLEPEIVEAILDGRQSEGVSLPVLMKGFPVEWEKQPLELATS